MLKRILRMGMVVIMLLGIFSGCGENALPYNAVMYGDTLTNRALLQDEFYEANLTSGSWSSAQEAYLDEAYPKTRVRIISDSTEYNEVFKSFPTDVDFEKTMIVMHCFTTSSGDQYEIRSITFDDQALIIKYNHPPSKGSTPPNASQPLTKWVIVTMDKLDIETGEFVFGN